MEVTSRVIDSPLGTWTHAEARPGHLAGVVESIWYFDGFVAERRERVFPSGVIEVIVHLGERYRVVEGGEATLCAPASLTGLQLVPLVVEAPASRSRVLGIRLHPVGAYAVLGVALGAVTGLTVDLEDVAGRAVHGWGARGWGAAELVERCQDAPSPAACLGIAAGWVERRLAGARVADPRVAWLAGEIERHAGAVSIGRLRERAGLSRTRLAERFREQVGVTPKLYARIRRFHSALRLLHRGAAIFGDDGGPVARAGVTPPPSLSRLALAAGYYDQPHMNAEFRELGGMTPVEYLRAHRYPGSASLAEGVP